MLFAIAVTAFFGLMFLSEILESKKQDRLDNPSEERGPTTPYPQMPYTPMPFHGGGPVWSPDRQYLWDGERWVRNENFLGSGIAIGIGIALAIYFLL